MNTVHHRKEATTQHSDVYPNVRVLAKELGIGYQSCYAALREGTIPCIRIGKRFVLPRAAIQDWLRTAGGEQRAGR